MQDFLTILIPQWGLFISIITGTILVGHLFNRLFRRFVQKSTVVIRNDPTNYHFLGHAIRAIIYLVGFSRAVYSVPDLRTVASSLLAGAGIVAVAIGFASELGSGPKIILMLLICSMIYLKVLKRNLIRWSLKFLIHIE